MRSCEEYEELISAAIDDELSQQDREKLEEHLTGCRGCRALYSDLLALHALLPTLSEQPPQALMEKTLEKLEEEKVVPLPRRGGRVHRWAPWAAAAAVCVVLLGLALFQAGRTGGAMTADAAAGGSVPIVLSQVPTERSGDAAQPSAAPAAPEAAAGEEPAAEARSGDTAVYPAEASKDLALACVPTYGTQGEPLPAPEPAAMPAAQDPAAQDTASQAFAPQSSALQPMDKASLDAAPLTQEEALERLRITILVGKDPEATGGEAITPLGLSEDGTGYRFSVTDPSTKGETTIYKVPLDGSEILEEPQ